jgi:hypothetical protein
MLAPPTVFSRTEFPWHITQIAASASIATPVQVTREGHGRFRPPTSPSPRGYRRCSRPPPTETGVPRPCSGACPRCSGPPANYTPRCRPSSAGGRLVSGRRYPALYPVSPRRPPGRQGPGARPEPSTWPYCLFLGGGFVTPIFNDQRLHVEQKSPNLSRNVYTPPTPGHYLDPARGQHRAAPGRVTRPWRGRGRRVSLSAIPRGPM